MDLGQLLFLQMLLFNDRKDCCEHEEEIPVRVIRSFGACNGQWSCVSCFSFVFVEIFYFFFQMKFLLRKT